MKQNASPETSRQRPSRNLSAWSIHRPVSTIAITSVILVLGILFSGRLPIGLLPHVDYPHIRVVVNYPGVTPEIIEEQVTRPLERNLSATENLSEIHGRASEGRSYIEMYFDYDTDIDLALQDAARQLERARTELPEGIDPPRLMKMDPSQSPVFELAISSDVRSPIAVREWVDQRLLPQLSSVPGVGTIDLGGGKVREIEVIADPERLLFYELTIGQIAEILSGRNIDQSIGNITSYEYDVLGRTKTRFRSSQDVANTLIPVRQSGSQVRLSDIATVEDAHREQRLFAYLGETEAVQVSIMKQPQANTVAVIQNIRQRIDELQTSGYITPDYQIDVIRDDSFFITSSIQSVTLAAILGALLAIVVIMLFLGSFRRSLIVTLMIPVAIIATFILMSAGNLTLNIMSLGGLALAVGLLIDNAIVMIENIHRHQSELEKPPFEAAIDGSREVLSAVITGTMTSLAAVLPFLLVTGLAALLFRELIFTIAFAILISLLAAVTLVPSLMARLKSSKTTTGWSARFSKRLHAVFFRIRDAYMSLLNTALNYKWILIIAAVLLLAGSLWLIRGLSTEFLPPVDDGRITFRFTLPSGTSIEPTNEVADIIRRTIDEMPHVQTQYMTVGGYFRGGQISVRGGMIDGVVQLAPHSERRGYAAEQWVSDFNAKMRDHQLPFIQQRVRGPRIEGLQTSLVDADIAVGITGDDLDALERTARSALRQIEHIPGIASSQIGRDAQIPQMLIRVDENRASAINLNATDVASLLHGAVDGIVPTRYVEGGFEYDVRVRYSRDITGTIDGLSQIPIMNMAGDVVHLGSLVSFEETTGPAHIERFNQIRVVWININIDMNEASIGDVGQQIQQSFEQFDLPDGISLIYAGEQESIEESGKSLRLAILLAVFFVFAVMAIQYERWFSPVVILLSLPFALIGVALALWITGLALSISVLLGIIFLTGIIVNNAILLVEFAETHRQQSSASTLEAITEAAKLRFRPIVMTTLTTVFGMLPLAIGIGEGYEILQPLAITVIGGMLVGTFLTLILLPGMYLLLSHLIEKREKADVL